LLFVVLPPFVQGDFTLCFQMRFFFLEGLEGLFGVGVLEPELVEGGLFEAALGGGDF
jgi:hypothetical protein